MPRLFRTIIPRIKKSFAERGILRTLLIAPRLPISLIRERNYAKKLARQAARSEFDERYGVDTDGDIGGGSGGPRSKTCLSDLDIPSSNWIYGLDYSPVPAGQFHRIIAGLALNFEEYVFVDFGSGKGRALLLASEFPFKKIMGVEFSPQLHVIAQSNFKKYSSPTQRCNSLESINMDFTDFQLPLEPCVLYFLDPCRASIYARILENVRKSWKTLPRRIIIVYISPLCESVFDSSGFLRKLAKSDDDEFSVYEVKEN
nr:class I SAM-dependent methyltransferase [Candidatus Acidoferrales bacterium]